MDEILYELREHIVGLNAGRWDYLFSLIKRLRSLDVVLPDRGQLTMTTPFMRAYTELLVKTCHRRGAHAMGGMAAFIPSRRDPEVNETRAREGPGGQGARGGRRLRRHVGRAPRPRSRRDGGLRRGARRATEPGRAAARRRSVSASDLLDLRVEGGAVTEEGLRTERQRRDPLHRVVAPRGRSGRDRQPDGGRGDRGDLAVAGLAVGARRQVHAGAGARGHGRGDARGRTVCGGDERSSNGWR